MLCEVVYAMQIDAGPTGFEISPQQRRLWLLQSDDKTLSAQIVLELDGNLDVLALRRAIDRVVARYEILRTTFRRVPGRLVPIQVVHDSLAVHWQSLNLDECIC